MLSLSPLDFSHRNRFSRWLYRTPRAILMHGILGTRRVFYRPPDPIYRELRGREGLVESFHSATATVRRHQFQDYTVTVHHGKSGRFSGRWRIQRGPHIFRNSREIIVENARDDPSTPPSLPRSPTTFALSSLSIKMDPRGDYSRRFLAFTISRISLESGNGLCLTRVKGSDYPGIEISRFARTSGNFSNFPKGYTLMKKLAKLYTTSDARAQNCIISHGGKFIRREKERGEKVLDINHIHRLYIPRSWIHKAASFSLQPNGDIPEAINGREYSGKLAPACRYCVN